MKYIKTIIFLSLLNFQFYSFAQDKSIFNKQLEDTLNFWGNSILNNAEDFVKYNANEHFTEILLNAINQKNSIDYPFDSLKTAFRYTSPDKHFRIINWNLPKKDGTFEYFCILQSFNKKEKQYFIYQLKDKSAEITIPENAILGPEKWYGALYYKVIPKEYKGKEYYTLLAWDGNNNVSRKKIIEVITFNEAGKPSFGAPIFKYENKIYKRIVFEYKANSVFTLRYEKQFSKLKKKKNDNQSLMKGKDFKWMIIYDRLIPEESNLKGFYQFYVPDKSIIDAFYFKKGKWIQIKNIDIRGKRKLFIQKPDFYKKDKEKSIYQPK